MNSIYSARFITAGEEYGKVCPIFKKQLNLKDGIKRAALNISALGVFEARIDGKRVGTDYMAPGWTVYPKRLQYFTYDVSDMLDRQSSVEIGIGHGWFSSRGGFPETKDGMYGKFPSLICSIDIQYNNGERETVYSDDTWDVAQSGILSSTIYDGEIVDARVVPVYKEKAKIHEYDHAVLIPKEGESVRETERVSVKELIHTPKGEWVLDFGQNLTGFVEFLYTSDEGGEEIRLECGEILDKDGNFYNDNYRTATGGYIYTAAPGWQVCKPKFTFFGFRYIRVSGISNIKPENFSAVVLHSDMPRTGYFKCGYEKLNKLYSNVIWGQRDNFLDIPTDCPQRDERLGWTGDAQVFARCASINYDTERFYTKWLRDVAVSQDPDGGVPYVVPHVLTQREKSSTAWSDATCIMPWEIYLAFGNKTLLREHLPMMKKWVEYMYRAPGTRYLYDSGTHFGDWLGIDAPEGSYTGSTDKYLISSAYFYYDTCILVKTLKVLGYKSERYERMAERIRAAFVRRFVKRGKLTSDTQTAHVLTLHFGLVNNNAELKEKLAHRLIKLIEERGDSLSTGFVGTPYLLDTLTEIGRPDKAYKLLLREQFPSWLFSVNMGATTIWEHWDGMKEDGSVWSVNMNSFNHYAYGSVAAWFYQTILGIRPAAPAYTQITFCPLPSRTLGFAKAKITTRSGDVGSEWVYEGNTVRYTFQIPEGCTADYRLVDGQSGTLGAGVHTLWAAAQD